MSVGFNKNFLNKNLYTKKFTFDSYDRDKLFIPNDDSNNWQYWSWSYTTLGTLLT